MPLHSIRHIGQLQLGIWKVEEAAIDLFDQVKLNQEEFATFQSFRAERRKREWLAVRILAKKMGVSGIQYQLNGKPIMSDSAAHLSISHTEGWVTVLCSNDFIGVDIEIISDKAEKIRRKFVMPEEEELVQRGILNYTQIWAAKESIYKKYSHLCSLEFKKDIEVKVENDKLMACVDYMGRIENNILCSETIEDCILVYTANV